jgi:hypothetical protein
MFVNRIVGLVGMLFALVGGPSEKRATFVVVGVHIDESKANDDNMHIVGTWAMDIELPANSNSAQVQTAAQAECVKVVGKGIRCAEMGQKNMSLGDNAKHPCAAIALGVYSVMNPDSVRRPYTLWPLKFGFDAGREGKVWGRAELRRLPSQNDNDPLIREVSVSTNCAEPAS